MILLIECFRSFVFFARWYCGCLVCLLCRKLPQFVNVPSHIPPDWDSSQSENLEREMKCQTTSKKKDWKTS